MRLRTRETKWNFTEMDHEFENFLMEMSCVAVMRLPYSMRCMMAERAHDCKSIINFFNYFRMMYCSYDINTKAEELLMMFLFMFICLVFVWMLSFNNATFFSPVLKIVCLKLRMNEYLAGVTFLAFGNACPDIIANLMPVRANAPIFTIAVGNALAIILISGGTVCFLRPFKMNSHCTVRDLLFLLLGVEVLRYVMAKNGPGTVTIWESVGKINSSVFLEPIKSLISCSTVLIFVYVVYVVINVLDLVIMRYTIKQLRKELEEMRRLPILPEKEYKDKMAKLASLEVDDELPIHDTTKYRVSRASGHQFTDVTTAGFIATPKQKDSPAPVDIETNRKYLYNAENPKNLMLFREFFKSLNPIDGVEWQLGGFCQRFFLIIRSPLVFILLIFIPVVDFEKDKHGWSKLLNCLQIVLNPFVVITLVHSAVSSKYHTWYIAPNFSISMWTPLLTLPVAIIIFLHARTDVPPIYHLLFTLLTFFSSMTIIWIAATELDVLSEIVGIVFRLSENFMAVTISAISNATPDMIANAQLTLQGYGRMAFAAIIGGPVFGMNVILIYRFNHLQELSFISAIVVSMSVAFVFNKRVREVGAASWVFGEHGEFCYYFLVITIITTLWWSITFDFHARRSAGVFMWCLFLLFMIYAICVEFEVVHDLTVDAILQPV
ncbi:hypothetical protein KR032_010181 [Drosophila birchii]|nr:hypothetical protein KR032_010181 [Drosophila birchii]